MSQLKRENHKRIGLEYEDPMDLVVSQANAIRNGLVDAEFEGELTN